MVSFAVSTSKMSTNLSFEFSDLSLLPPLTLSGVDRQTASILSNPLGSIKLRLHCNNSIKYGWFYYNSIKEKSYRNI